VLGTAAVSHAIDQVDSAGPALPGGEVADVESEVVVASAANAMVTSRDATAHAEVRAIRAAQSAIGDARLSGCILYVTLEPCAMCAGAIVHCRIRRVIFGCPDARGGAAGGFINLLQQPNLNHRSEVTPWVMENETRFLLVDFFGRRRRENEERRARGE
jgi:tRNA(adenine34) deaminase